MSNYPRKPQRGQKALQSIYNSVCQIIDYLPTLTVTGDNKTTYVNHSAYGTTIHSVQPTLNYHNSKKGVQYEAGSGISITSGTTINAMITGGANINVWQENGYIIISGTPEGSGGGGPGSDTTYIGDKNNYGSGHIYVSQTGSSPRLISSDLYYIENLVNYPLVASSNIVMPNSLTACNNTVDFSQVGTIYNNHFIQTRDILHDGVGTKVNFSWTRNPFGSQDEGGTNGIVEGLQVDLTLSGGQFADVVLHKHVFGAYEEGTGTRYDPPTQSRVDCLITGTFDHYPHTSGFIDVVPVEMEDEKIWGVVSTNLHGDETTIHIDPADGTISCMIDPGGTTVIASGVQYPNYQELRHDDYGSVSGIGISWLLPVKKNSNVCFYTAAGSEHAYATFASNELNEDDQYERATIYNGEPYVPSADGYVRLSVFDDGTHNGECLRFTDNYSDSNSWNYATPLYRFHGFKTLSGDGTTIDVVGNTISGKYTGDGSKIQVQGNTISWIGGEIGGGFKAPDYKKLDLGANDGGIAASGMGTTYLVPISKGCKLKLEGTAVVSRWAPVEGSTGVNAFNFGSSYSSSTSTDGYVRVTVMDDGTRTGECVRLFVKYSDNTVGELPLHKYGPSLSGAYGIAIENNGIRNMIQAGTGLTSTALMTTGTNPVMTGIAFDLSSQYAADLASISGRLSATTNEDRILSSHNGTLLWAENTASYTPPSTVYDLLSQGSGIQLTKLSDGKTKIDCTVQGGGGGSIVNKGMPWPNYENLSNYSSTVNVGTDYTAGPNGGWLRVSYKGKQIQDCYGVKIDGHPVGLYSTNWSISGAGAGVGVSGTIGCTWLLPVPPKQRFYIEFPADVTFAYFDGSKYNTSDINYYYGDISAATNNAKENMNNAKDECSDAWYYAEDLSGNWRDYQNSHDIDDLWSVGTYQDEWRDASGNAQDAQYYANQASGCADSAIDAYNDMIYYQTDIMGDAIEYKTSAIAYAEEAASYATSAVQAAQKAYDYYLSACNVYGVSPEEY